MIDVSMPFRRTLALTETQAGLLSIQTQVSDSISQDDNHNVV